MSIFAQTLLAGPQTLVAGPLTTPDNSGYLSDPCGQTPKSAPLWLTLKPLLVAVKPLSASPQSVSDHKILLH